MYCQGPSGPDLQLGIERGGAWCGGMQSRPPSPPRWGRAPDLGLPESARRLPDVSASRSNLSDKALRKAKLACAGRRNHTNPAYCVPAGPAGHGGGGNLGPGLREDVLACGPVPARCGQWTIAGASAASRRMSVPHRLCAPFPQPPGLVRHAGGRPQPGATTEHIP